MPWPPVPPAKVRPLLPSGGAGWSDEEIESLMDHLRPVRRSLQQMPLLEQVAMVRWWVERRMYVAIGWSGILPEASVQEMKGRVRVGVLDRLDQVGAMLGAGQHAEATAAMDAVLNLTSLGPGATLEPAGHWLDDRTLTAGSYSRMSEYLGHILNTSMDEYRADMSVQALREFVSAQERLQVPADCIEAMLRALVRVAEDDSLNSMTSLD